MSASLVDLDATAKYIAADPKSPKEILNVAGGKVYHKNEPDVDSGDTELAEGGSVQITEGKFFISATKSEIRVRELTTVTVEDVTTVDDVTVGDDATVKGKLAVTEGATVEGTDGIVASGNGGKDTLALSNTTANVGMTIGADSNLYRPEANTLKTDDALKVAGTLAAEGAATVGTTLGVTGASTLTGGIAGGKPYNAATWQPLAATSGTDTTAVAETIYVGSVFLGQNATITGISYLVGSSAGEEEPKVVVALHKADGTLVAESAEAAVGTKEQVQAVNFKAPYAAVGPAVYFVTVSYVNVTAEKQPKLRTVPAHVQAGVIGKTVAFPEVEEAPKYPEDIAAPTTFTADQVPVAFLH